MMLTREEVCLSREFACYRESLPISNPSGPFFLTSWIKEEKLSFATDIPDTQYHSDMVS